MNDASQSVEHDTDELAGASKILTPLESESLGATYFGLLVNQHEWIYRRVETVSLAENRRFRTQMSIDFRVSSEALEVARRLGVQGLAVPLMLLEKRSLVALDVRDESGTVLPILTRTQNGDLGVQALASVLHGILGLDGQVKESDIRDVVFGSGAPSGPVFAAIDTKSTAESIDKEMLALVRWAAASLASRFVLAVEVPLKNLEMRRVVKVSYEVGDGWVTPADRSKSVTARTERSLGRLGLSTSTYRLVTPEIANCGSYHFEFRPPVGIQLDKAVFGASDKTALSSLKNTDYRVMPSICHAAAAIELPAGSVRGEDPNFGVLVSVLPAPEGMILASLLTGCVATLLLLFGVHLGRRLLHLPSDPSVALLLVAPGAVATLLARPGEHVLASRLLRGVRLLAIAPGLATFVAAALLASKPSARIFVDCWQILAIIAFFSTELLGLIAYQGLAASRRHSRTVRSETERGGVRDDRPRT